MGHGASHAHDHQATSPQSAVATRSSTESFLLRHEEVIPDSEKVLEYVRAARSDHSSYISLIPLDLERDLESYLVKLPADTLFYMERKWVYEVACSEDDNTHVTGAHIVLSSSKSPPTALAATTGKVVWQGTTDRALPRTSILSHGYVVGWGPKSDLYFFKCHVSLGGPITSVCTVGELLYAVVSAGSGKHTLWRVAVHGDSAKKTQVSDLHELAAFTKCTLSASAVSSLGKNVVVVATQPQDLGDRGPRMVRHMFHYHDWNAQALVVIDGGSTQLFGETAELPEPSPISTAIRGDTLISVWGKKVVSAPVTDLTKWRALTTWCTLAWPSSWSITACGRTHTDVAVLTTEEGRSDLVISDEKFKPKRIFKGTAARPASLHSWCMHRNVLVIGNEEGVVEGFEISCSVKVFSHQVCKGRIEWVASVGDFIIARSNSNVSCWHLRPKFSAA